MSHVTPIEREEGWETSILKEMCKTFSWEFCEGQKTYKWYEGLGQCDHAISIPGCNYEIGVINKGGKIDLSWDSWRTGGLGEVLGEDAGLLKRNYDVAKAKVAARSKGHSFSHDFSRSRPGWIKATVKIGGW